MVEGESAAEEDWLSFGEQDRSKHIRAFRKWFAKGYHREKDKFETIDQESEGATYKNVAASVESEVKDAMDKMIDALEQVGKISAQQEAENLGYNMGRVMGAHTHGLLGTFHPYSGEALGANLIVKRHGDHRFIKIIPDKAKKMKNAMDEAGKEVKGAFLKKQWEKVREHTDELTPPTQKWFKEIFSNLR